MSTSSKWKDLPTEAINPNTLAMDRASTDDLIRLMLSEDRKVLAAVQREKAKIATGADLLTAALRRGGRLIFVGAGTSGRLGVLEAAEMVPTFSTPARLVQAIMAGGRSAFFHPKDGAEDNYDEGGRAVARLRPSRKDVLIGVSASGMTQFVRGALTRARRAGVKIVFVTCWPGTELQTFVDVVIAPAVGPEVIAGSTRLKAGTATKMVLNMLTTIAMVHIGKTYSNLMVDVKTGSEKARDRARRIITTVTGLDYDAAGQLLRRARWNVKAAIVMERTGDSYAAALVRLKRANDVVRSALGEDAGCGSPAVAARAVMNAPGRSRRRRRLPHHHCLARQAAVARPDRRTRLFSDRPSRALVGCDGLDRPRPRRARSPSSASRATRSAPI